MVIKCPLEVRLSARDTFGLLPACTDLFVPRVRASTAHASQPHDETQTSPDLVGVLVGVRYAHGRVACQGETKHVLAFRQMSECAYAGRGNKAYKRY